MAGAERRAAFPHQSALDGVRALAVAAVVGFHLPISVAGGGFVGVDIFFVLSGFLITTLLVIERRGSGRVDLLRFWGRRIRRLLPALLLLLVLVAAYAVIAAPSTQLDRIRSDGLATLFYVANWRMAATTSVGSPLTHTWSLAIEEQWYLIWPPLFLLLSWLLRGRSRALFVAALALAVASAVDMAILGETRRAYYGTDARVQALLLGAALAFLLQFAPGPTRRASKVALEAIGVVGALVLLAFVARPVPWMGRGGYLLVALASVALIAAVTQPTSPVLRRVLSWQPLVALGLISYGVYLYHFVVIVWLSEGRTGLEPVLLAVLQVAVTLAIATASYFVVEMPVRRGTFLPPRARAVAAPLAVVAMAVILIVTTAGSRPAEADRDASFRLWRYAKNHTEAGARRVLFLGDATPVAVAIAMRGPYDEPGIRGLALGSVACPLRDAVGEPVAGVPSVPGCAAARHELENSLRGYRPEVVLVADEPSSAGTAAVVVAWLRKQHPGIEVRTVPLVAGTPLAPASGPLTVGAARTLWAGLAHEVADRAG